MTTMTLCLSQSCNLSSLMYNEGRHDVAETLATACAVNTVLKQVSMTDLPLLPVMKSLTNRKTPLNEMVIKRVSFIILYHVST